MNTVDATAMRSRMPPPLPSLVAVILGLICDWLAPWPVARYVYALGCGVVLVGAVVALSAMTARAFKGNGTSPSPRSETLAIIATGPFKFSRNPVYVAVALLQAALGFIFNTVWILLLTPPAMIVIHHVVVLQEEAYLQSKFGRQYLDYKSRVRRWL